MSNIGNWTYNKSEDGNWCEDDFPTREEAIEVGKQFAKEEDLTQFYVGQIAEIPIISHIDADDIIERTAEKIDEDYGGDYDPGDKFDDNLQCGDSERLQKLLDEAFYKWVEEKNIKCPCFTIENIEQVIITEQSEEDDQCQPCHNALRCLDWSRNGIKAKCTHWNYFKHNYASGNKRIIGDDSAENPDLSGAE